VVVIVWQERYNNFKLKEKKMVNKTYNFHYRIKNGDEIHKYTSFAKNYIFLLFVGCIFNNKMIEHS
jgi:hypothetical protein